MGSTNYLFRKPASVRLTLAMVKLRGMFVSNQLVQKIIHQDGVLVKDLATHTVSVKEKRNAHVRTYLELFIARDHNEDFEEYKMKILSPALWAFSINYHGHSVLIEYFS